MAWEEQNGSIPDGMLVLHHCDNPPCYEITHLYLGTAADNTRDMITRQRQALRGRLPQSKLTVEEVASIQERYAASGVTQTQLAAEYGVSQGAISSILRDRKKTGLRRRTIEEVAAIRAGFEAGLSQAELARQFELNQSSVSEIVRRKTHA